MLSNIIITSFLARLSSKACFEILFMQHFDLYVFISVFMFCICLYLLCPGVGGISCPAEEAKPVATIGGNSEPGGRSLLSLKMTCLFLCWHEKSNEIKSQLKDKYVACASLNALSTYLERTYNLQMDSEFSLSYFYSKQHLHMDALTCRSLSLFNEYGESD